MGVALIYSCTSDDLSVQVMEALAEYNDISAMCVGLLTSMPKGTSLQATELYAHPSKNLNEDHSLASVSERWYQRIDQRGIHTVCHYLHGVYGSRGIYICWYYRRSHSDEHQLPDRLNGLSSPSNMCVRWHQHNTLRSFTLGIRRSLR
jgi:hypothetical protein